MLLPLGTNIRDEKRTFFNNLRMTNKFLVNFKERLQKHFQQLETKKRNF